MPAWLPAAAGAASALGFLEACWQVVAPLAPLGQLIGSFLGGALSLMVAEQVQAWLALKWRRWLR